MADEKGKSPQVKKSNFFSNLLKKEPQKDKDKEKEAADKV